LRLPAAPLAGCGGNPSRSFYVYNTTDEVDALVDALATARRVYQRKTA